jgi:hypothetical protein
MVVYDLDKERAKKLPQDILDKVDKVVQLRVEAESLTVLAQSKVEELLTARQELDELVKKAEENQLTGEIIKTAFENRKGKNND